MAKDNKTKTIAAKAVPSKGVESYPADTAKRTVERLGYRKIIMRSDSESAMVVLKEAARRESDVAIALEEVFAGDHQTGRWRLR